MKTPQPPQGKTKKKLPPPEPGWLENELDPDDWTGIFNDDLKAPEPKDYKTQTRKQDLDNARAAGCVVIDRRPNRLLLDLDTADQVTHMFQMLGRLNGAGLGLDIVENWSSKSGGSHVHYVLESSTGRHFTDTEAIALQSILGSDPMREYMSLKRIWDGEPAFVSVLFRPNDTTTTTK